LSSPSRDSHERARKIKPQFSEGELVRVATGRQQPEAELIQNLLLEEGVPSALRRTRGFDVPEMLAAGPRDVLVPQSGVVTAHEVLRDAILVSDEPGPAPTSPLRLLLWLLAGTGVVAAISVLLDLITA
jgi:hypothetical protein